MESKELARSIIEQNGYVIYFIISFVAFAWLIYSEHKRLKLIFTILLSNRHVASLDRNEQERSSRFNILSRLMYFFNVALLLFWIFNYYKLPNDDNVFLLITILACVILWYWIKNIIIYFLGWMFKMDDKSKDNIYYNQISTSLLGFLLFPLLVLVHYQQLLSFDWFIYFFAIVFFFILMLKSFRLFQISLVHYGLFKYHNILYICTLEFLPLIVLIKLFIGKM